MLIQSFFIAPPQSPAVTAPPEGGAMPCPLPSGSSSCPLLWRGVGGWATSYTLVLGGFDGLHLGHRALLAAAKEQGLPVALTTMFGGKGKELFTKEERHFLFEQAGISYLLELNLTEEVMSLSAEEFLDSLFALVPVGNILCGEDFRFGKDAFGTPDLLKRLAPCPVSVLPIVKERGEKVSVSVCKHLLGEGQLSRLNALLGDGYFIGGTVEHGREVGRTYGFPTLNLSVPKEKLLPPDGVYGGLCRTPKGNFPTIVNIGARPTFGVEERKIEAYLDGFSGDLYGAEVAVYPMEFYRPIAKFPSAEALKSQLERDISRLRS